MNVVVPPISDTITNAKRALTQAKHVKKIPSHFCAECENYKEEGDVSTCPHNHRIWADTRQEFTIYDPNYRNINEDTGEQEIKPELIEKAYANR